jgi:ATP-binding cassette subfamily B protein
VVRGFRSTSCRVNASRSSAVRRGKSTLATLVVRLLRPAEDSISTGGVDVARVRLDELRLHIALMMQYAVPFADTVRDNLRMV